VSAASAPPPSPPPSSPASPCLLREAQPGRSYRVLGVDGDDALAHRLVACGFWAGAVVERLQRAPFGDPLLFRVHGFRLALRGDEAARVRVVGAT